MLTKGKISSILVEGKVITQYYNTLILIKIVISCDVGGIAITTCRCTAVLLW